MIDLRTEKFVMDNITNKEDINEVYRDLCVIHKMPMNKAKAFTDSQQGISLYGLIKLCVHFNLKLHLDAMKGEMIIWHPEEGNPPVKVILDDETTKVIEENNADLKYEEANIKSDFDDTVEKFTYQEIKQEPLEKPDEDDMDDLF